MAYCTKTHRLVCDGMPNCDPVQQKVHRDSQVYSEIMNKIVRKMIKKRNENADFEKVVFPKV